MERPPMYSTTRSRSPRLSSPSSGAEIDLRAEFDLLIFGSATEVPHGHLILIRNMRRDADGYPTRCTCVQVESTTEPDPDCSYCAGEGYLWDESWKYCYSMHATSEAGMAKKYVHVPPGLERTDYVVFFLRYDTVIKFQDKIVEVRLDDEGDPVIPYVREAIYKPHTIKNMRSDHGRKEFLAIFCREEDAWKSDNP